jgi:hypothetical protein
MSRASGALAASACFLSFFITGVQGNTFLKAHSASRQEHMRVEDVQTSLLAEVEGTLGEGAASSRLKQLEAALEPMYAALPKNEKGYLGHATVRYALHRLFVQRHGWVIKGLEGNQNWTSNTLLLKEQVPAYVQDLFEQRLGDRGFGLHELGVLAATIEHLVHSEAIKRLGDSFKLHRILPTALLSKAKAEEVLDTYMMGYILGENLANMSLRNAESLKKDMPDIYLAWHDTRKFVQQIGENVTRHDGSAEQKNTGVHDFSLVTRIAERVGERFGEFQDEECRQIKSSLVKLDERGTGRVLLADFYKPALEGVAGSWQFQESSQYLRQVGALDETDPEKPRVIIANYVSGPANCIASSSFYSVCCLDACEDLLRQLEKQIAAPEATVEQISSLVPKLVSTSVQVPQTLSPTLLGRLEEIAGKHEGKVQLHGRLFAQWLHHVFPRECPYPHVSGTTNPQTADEWLQSTGEDTTASDDEMRAHAETASSRGDRAEDDLDIDSLPWSLEEELLVVRPLPGQSQTSSGLFSTMRSALLFAAMVATIYGMVRSPLSGASSPGGAACSEKFLV